MVLITESPCGGEMGAQWLARPADMQAPKCASHEQARRSRSSAAPRRTYPHPGSYQGAQPWGPLHPGSDSLYFLPGYLNPQSSHSRQLLLSLVAQIRKQVHRGSTTCQGRTVSIRTVSTDVGSRVLSFYLILTASGVGSRFSGRAHLPRPPPQFDNSCFL